MRYTTVIDITETPELYRNINVRLLYLHLCLKSGWHDADRDRISVSIRTLAADCGLTVSATRHAIRKLMEAQLLKREADRRWYVKKWHMDTPPAPRPKKNQAEAARSLGAAYDKAKSDRNERDERQRQYQNNVLAAVRASTKEELLTWLGEMEAGKYQRHHGVVLNPNAANISWLRSVIEKM